MSLDAFGQSKGLTFKGDTLILVRDDTTFISPKRGGATANILDAYPVGSVYISTTSTNPSQLFGGTWEAFAVGRTLIGIDPSQTEFDAVNETGGAKTKTLSESEMPAHTHTVAEASSASGGAGTMAYDANSAKANSMNTGSAGSGTAFSIMNPYLVVFIFRRTN